MSEIETLIKEKFDEIEARLEEISDSDEAIAMPVDVWEAVKELRELVEKPRFFPKRSKKILDKKLVELAEEIEETSKELEEDDTCTGFGVKSYEAIDERLGGVLKIVLDKRINGDLLRLLHNKDEFVVRFVGMENGGMYIRVSLSYKEMKE